jgi:predicted RND superfamily exporter protein
MFPLILVLGFMGAVGMDLRVTTVIVFTISLGLAVDDTIHFMARFREEWQHEQGSGPGAYERAIERTFHGTGSAILLTTILLAAGFSALLFSNFPISQTFALCMEITVFGALIGDLVILPAALAVFKPFKQTPAEGDLPSAGA